MKNNKVNFDPIVESIGSIGKWQILIIFSISLVKIPMAWQFLGNIFMAAPTNFECKSKENDRCSKNCTSYVFDQTIFESTIISEWDMVCDRAQLANVVQMIFMAGILIGSLIFGSLADKFGRVKPLICAVIIQGFSGTINAFISSLSVFLVLRFICACAVGGTMTTSFIYVMELVGTDWRSLVSILFNSVFNIGILLLILLSYNIRNWRVLQFWISFPSLFMIFYVLLPESPRWLIAVGDKNRAIEVLKQGAKFNRLKGNVEEIVVHAMQKSAQNKSENFILLLKSKKLRKQFISVCVIWMVETLCYFGASQYVGQIDGNIFSNMTVSAVMQLPALYLCIVWVKYLGRKLGVIVNLITSGVSFLLILFFEKSRAEIVTVLASFGIFFVSSGQTIFFLFASEIFPTVVRGTALSAASTFGRFGGLLAPFVAGLRVNYSYLPPIIFGIVPIVAAALTVVLPETSGRQIPETIEDGELFEGKDQSLKCEEQ